MRQAPARRETAVGPGAAAPPRIRCEPRAPITNVKSQQRQSLCFLPSIPSCLPRASTYDMLIFILPPLFIKAGPPQHLLQGACKG